MPRKKAIEPTDDLLPGLGIGNTSRQVPSGSWKLVTNQRNLLYMLAAGMAMPPRGFGHKYYQDSLSIRPGWIPLYRPRVPAEAIRHATSEGRASVPCLAGFHLDRLRGRIQAAGENGKFREIAFPDELAAGDVTLFVPAPLPISWIESIEFRNSKDISGCRMDAKDFENVPLSNFTLRTNAKALDGDKGLAWPPEIGDLEDFDRSPDVPLACGGALAVLAHLANRSDRLVDFCRWAFDPDEDAGSATDAMLRPLGEWRRTGQIGEAAELPAKVFWGAVNRIARARSEPDKGDPVGVLLAYLEEQKARLDEKFADRLVKLANDLKSLSGLSDKTVTEIFERHPKPFSRAMNLFCLRGSSAEFLRFRHPALTVDDYAAAAILFAARDGWLGLPVGLRDLPGLWPAVVDRMAQLAHRIAGSGIQIETASPRPRPLRELLLPGESGWNARQRAAALELSKRMKWVCIRTTVSLGKGEYRVRVDGQGVHIDLDRDVDAVRAEVVTESFLQRLGEQIMSRRDEEDIRKILA